MNLNFTQKKKKLEPIKTFIEFAQKQLFINLNDKKAQKKQSNKVFAKQPISNQ